MSALKVDLPLLYLYIKVVKNSGRNPSFWYDTFHSFHPSYRNLTPFYTFAYKTEGKYKPVLSSHRGVN